MKLKPHLSISLSDDDLRTIVIIFRCYSRLRLWTLDSPNSSFASAPKLQCRPCMKMKLPQNAGHGHILGPSRPHPTPTRSRTQKKEKKRKEARDTKGLLAPKIWNQMTQRNPMWKMPVVRLSSHRSTPQGLNWSIYIPSSTHKPNKIHQLAVYLNCCGFREVSIGPSRQKWAITVRHRGRRWRGCQLRWPSTRFRTTGQTSRWSLCLSAPPWPMTSTPSASASSSTRPVTWQRSPRSARANNVVTVLQFYDSVRSKLDISCMRWADYSRVCLYVLIILVFTFNILYSRCLTFEM